VCVGERGVWLRVKIKGEQKKNKAQTKLICQWIKGNGKKGAKILDQAKLNNCTNSKLQNTPARGGDPQNFISE